MSDLKKAWKKTAKSLILAANDFGEAVIESVREGKDKAVNWAQSEEGPIETEGTEVSSEDKDTIIK